MRLLTTLVADARKRDPGAVAVSDADGELRYDELDDMSNRVAAGLRELGVQPGDRVGIWLPKSARGVAAMQAALRLGAVYVPIDPMSPAGRMRAVAESCSLGALVTTTEGAEEAAACGLTVRTLSTGEARGGLAWADVEQMSAEPFAWPERSSDDLAYILYTSGSTGTPKGVCISHENARAFVDWSVELLGARAADRFANHAPFHFDLSVLDLYCAFAVGGSVHVVSETAAYHARHLVDFVEARRISVWYSVPSALVMMMSAGLADVGHRPRAIIFAGEVFPMRHLRRLRSAFPDARLLNFYGPTETNVCTFYEVGSEIPEDATAIPIGRASCGDRVWAQRPDGSVAQPGEEGELLVDGPTVMLGYWGKPAQRGPYPTGDVVRLRADGDYEYVGRRDHMVKVRGYRIELGEIENALVGHADVQECAVVVKGEGLEAQLVAFLVAPDRRPSLLALKEHCAARLPRYMIVDKAVFVESMPKTPNGKIDRRKLIEGGPWEVR